MKRFWHIGINVTDLDRSIEFYKLVGFRHLEDKHVETPDVGRAFMVEGGDHLRFAHMRIGEDENEAMLDLIQWINPPTQGRAEPSLLHPGLCRFSIISDDVDGEYERLTAAGVQFLQPPSVVQPEGSPRGWKILFAEDPDGTLFHFLGLVGALAAHPNH